ncbi:Microcystin LR degradation protein MlrC [Niveomyces insectorum RCEF 264]|uniref:Microcystin LR degradation protein MlrC n=1 Tax=Niveomyces insectorum RCEF 264 TaxID=1081102 RepID=A0A167NGJ2_9HYPO|nr:Microcystin LR degradation protein MlrC [Niveomyces insectorum RCEF 264]
MTRRPVIAIAGLACETSTFTPSRTDAAAFHPKRGDAAVVAYHFLDAGTPLAAAADWRGTLIGHALPGGIVTRPAYESLANEIVQRLAAITASTALDGLWLDIHGAMVVEGLDDAEADLLRRVRAVIGPDVLVSASMDLHGNVSRPLVHMLDLITCYRMAPHEDALDTKERACRNLVDCLTAKEGPEAGAAASSAARRPLKAWVPIPILLPGEQTSTRDEPAKHIYAAVPTVEALPGVLDAAIWVGYAWADQPRNRAVVVVTGWDSEAVAAGAERLARLFWAARADFHFVAPTGSLDACLDTALSPTAARPYFISDSGDNPTAGGSGDVTWGLTQLLARPEFRDENGDDKGGLLTSATAEQPAQHIRTVIYASIPGPEAVRAAVAAGVGSTVTVTAGAAVDNIHAGPITLTGTVHAIRHGDRHARIEVVLRVRRRVFVILTELRKPYHYEHDFTALDLQPRLADIVLVKIGYLEPELYAMAADWMLALTPGGVDQDLQRLGHQRIKRPMWPFDKTFDVPPNLSARMIPLSVEKLLELDE